VRRTAALIVGGGPAGAAAATVLARGGVQPLLLERSREPADALCGGFLSWRTLERLAGLGLDPAGLGGHPIGRVRLLCGRAVVESGLPGGGIGLSRHRLDSVLLARAARAGVAVERGVRVATAEPGTVRTGDGFTIQAEALFLATGKHELRGMARPDAAPGADPALGLRARLRPGARLARWLDGTIELHLFRGGYAGLLLQEDGTANLCMAVRRSRLVEAGNRTDALFAMLAREAPLLGERLAAGTGIGRIGAVARVPYGWRATGGVPGLFRLGDQAAVIPSLAGEGVGIALASGTMAAEAFLRGGAAAAADYQRGFARRLAGPLRWAGVLKTVAERPAAARAALAAAWLTPGALPALAAITRVPRD
jgi:menaquinone-9 beta-reductase